MILKKFLLPAVIAAASAFTVAAHSGPELRRPIDNTRPAWLIHIDVWNTPDPQAIIDMVPDDIRPYVIFNLSTSSNDKQSGSGPMIYDTWLKTCALNGVWAMIQCASGAYSRMPEHDTAEYERYFSEYPCLVGFNFAEQFWGFGDEGQVSFPERLQLFADLMPVCHQYGGYLAVSFTQAYYSADMMPIAFMKRNEQMADFLRNDPDHFLCFEKYTMSNAFLDIESNTLGAWLGGYAGQYGIRFDACGWMLPDQDGCDFVKAAGLPPIAEHVSLSGATILDGPETIPLECSRETSVVRDADGYTCRRWEWFPHFKNINLDFFRKILDGSVSIPTKLQVLDRTKVAIVNDLPVNEEASGLERFLPYLTPRTLFDGLYRHACDQGGIYYENHWLENRWWLKSTGRYPTLPQMAEIVDPVAKNMLKTIAVSEYDQVWTTDAKHSQMRALFPSKYSGDIYADCMGAHWVAYNPYQYDETVADSVYTNGNPFKARHYAPASKRAKGTLDLRYNTCGQTTLDLAPYSLALLNEESNRISIYLNNYQDKAVGDSYAECDPVIDMISIVGASSRPSVSWADRGEHSPSEVKESWENGTLLLEITHNGPLDIFVACAGSHKRPAVPSASSVRLPDPPAQWNGRLQFEAECFPYRDTRSCVKNGFRTDGPTDFYGMGYLKFGTSLQGSARVSLAPVKPGNYTLTLRYSANVSAECQVSLSHTRRQTISLPATVGWGEAECKITVDGDADFLYIDNSAGKDFTLDCIFLDPEESSLITTVADYVYSAGVAEFFNLQGVRVAAPAEGEIYIRRDSDGRTSKIRY